MEMDVSLLSFVVMEYMFGTLKSSLPRLWNLGTKYLGNYKKNDGKISKNSKQSMLF